MGARGSILLGSLLIGAALTLAGCAAGPGSAPVSVSGGNVPPEAAGSTVSVTAAPNSTAPAPSATATGQTGAAAGSLAGRTIVVDPGHNGANGRHLQEINAQVDAGGFRKACNTTGTSEAGVTESAVNWAIGQAVAERLRAAGATVVLTRTDDTGWGPCIDERGRLAGSSGADLLVSIHADGAASGHGFHVITPGAVPGYTDGIVEPSRELAGDIRDALVADGFPVSTYAGSNGIHVRTDLGTLNQARVPAVMLELGNMHDPSDFALLSGPEGQARYADGITVGVARFLTAG